MRQPLSKKLFFALAASVTLLASACTANPTGPNANPSSDTGGANTTAADIQNSPLTIADIEGRTSTAFGTEGMEPISTLAEVTESAAANLDVDPATDARWERYFQQEIAWGECEDPKHTATECTYIEVPLKWNDPEAESIKLLVNRIPARGSDKIGSLLLNPGGPGASGADLIGGGAPEQFSADILSAYDLIGFDPRGVKASNGIQCLNDADTDAYLSADGAESEATDWMQRISEACSANSGNILPYLDTFSAARDMDVIRAVLGEEKLDYLGYSYGTFLGATYAELYPEKVDLMVLDAPIDPSLTGDEIAAGQAAGLQQSAETYVQWCLDRPESCPLQGSVEDGLQQIQDFLAQVTEQPIETSSGRQLTGSLALTGILLPLYADETWEFLNLALTSAFEGNGDTLLMLADLANERNADGTFASNSAYAIRAINCLDHLSVIDEDWVAAESQRLASLYPLFGESLAGPGIGCASWPAAPVRIPQEIKASGSPTILLIGTTGDMATPYAWAEALDQQLENSVLVTFKGQGHTAFGRSGGCVEEIVQNYLLNGATPAVGTVCDPLAQGQSS